MRRKRILVAYDGTERSFWALQHAADAAASSDAEIGVVTVMPRIVEAPSEALRYLFDHGLEAEIHVPVGSDAAREITRIAAESNYDEVYVGRPEGRSTDDLETTVSASLAHLAPANVLTAF